MNARDAAMGAVRSDEHPGLETIHVLCGELTVTVESMPLTLDARQHDAMRSSVRYIDRRTDHAACSVLTVTVV